MGGNWDALNLQFPKSKQMSAWSDPLRTLFEIVTPYQGKYLGADARKMQLSYAMSSEGI